MRALLALVAVALLILLGFNIIGAAVQEAGTDHTVTNETFTPSTSSYVTLNESNRDDVSYVVEDSVTVHDENGTLVDSGDYDWERTNGTIKAASGGQLDGDANATITYRFAETTENQRQFRGLFTNVLDASAVLVFVLGVAVVLGAIRVLG